MSSKFVRQSIMDFITNEFPTEKVLDLTAMYLNLDKMLEKGGVAADEPWLGVQFLGASEVCVDIRGTNSRGKYREDGIIYLHIVDIAKLGVHNAILNRAEAIINKFRGQRINGTVIIESVAPPVFGEGATLSFEGGYTAALIQIDYQRDLDL